MAKLKIDHPLFQQIRSEHDEIRSHLESPFENRQWLMENSEIQHHRREEIILFSSLAQHARLTEGGPLCSMFFHRHMMNPPIQTCEQLIGKTPTIEDHQKDYYSKNLPLRIPTDEHRAGKAILEYTMDKGPEVRGLLQYYKDLQVLHMEKEETCLFHLCINLISEETADQLLARWRTSS